MEQAIYIDSQLKFQTSAFPTCDSKMLSPSVKYFVTKKTDLGLKGIKLIILREPRESGYNPQIKKLWGRSIAACIGSLKLLQSQVKYLEEPGRMLIGYTFTQKKLRLAIQSQYIHSNKQIQFVAVGVGQPGIDLPAKKLLHKRLKYGQQLVIQLLIKLEESNNQLLVGDATNSFSLMRRSAMNQILLSAQSQCFRVPKYYICKTKLQLLQKARLLDCQSVIVKSDLACGHSLSHTMLVAKKQELNLDNLKSFQGQAQMLVSAFIQQANLIKTYVIGESIFLVPESKDYFIQEEARAEIHRIVFRLKRFKLELFGLDVLIDFKGLIWGIDLNFFPSYVGVANLPQQIKSYLLAKGKYE